MVWLIVAAIAAGLIGGMGMGGGTVFIPLLTQGLNVPQHLAQWLNLVSFVPMAIVSLAIHVKNKLLDKRGFWTLLIPSAISAVVCALLAVKTSPKLLGIIFSFFLAAMGIVGLSISIKKAVDEKRRNTPQEPEDLASDTDKVRECTRK